MRQHVTVVGALHIGLSALGIVTAIAIMVILGLVGALAYDQGLPMPATLLGIVGASVAAFLALLSLPGLVGGIGLLRFRRWAKILVLIVAAFNLLNFPVGTVIGGYSLWVLTHPATDELFVS